MLNINDELIRDVALNSNTIIKGKQYFLSKRVTSLQSNKSQDMFRAVVAGTKKYQVDIYFEQGDFKSAYCNCPAYDEYWGVCKHIVAVLLEIKRRDQQGCFKQQMEVQSVKKLMDFFHDRNTATKRPVELEITYEYDPSVSKSWSSCFTLRMGEKKLYIIKSPKEFIYKMESNETMVCGKEFTYDPETHYFRDEDLPIIELLKELYEYEHYFLDKHGDYNRGIFSGKKVYLTNSSLKRFFKAIEQKSFNVQIKGTLYKNIRIIEEEIPLRFTLEKEKDNLLFRADNYHSYVPLTERGEYFFARERIYKIPSWQREGLLPLASTVLKSDNSTVRIPKEYREQFISEVYPIMNRVGKTHIDEAVQSDIYGPPIQPQIYLDMDEEKLMAEILFTYGDITIEPYGKGSPIDSQDHRILIRNYDKEMEIIRIIEDSGFKIKNNQLFLDEEELIFSFIYRDLQELQRLSTIFYSENFKRFKIKDKTAVAGGIRFSSSGNTLEFSFGIDGLDNREIVEVFRSLREKKKYYRLRDGSFLPLDLPELSEVQTIFDTMDLEGDFLSIGMANLPKHRAFFIEEQLKDANIKSIKRSKEVKEFVQNVREPGDNDYKVPGGLDRVLREYQKVGFKWLKTLADYGLGGILADDMGLGKTLQVLTFLLSEKEEKGPMPSMIVAPTSLVYNWAWEIEKFTPELKALVISGNKNERAYNMENIMDYDVVITSYPLIRRDVELYEQFAFRYCILDEAQHIKNPGSQNAKSVKDIKANNFFALTGTPIENSLTELWSIFDYIMPGYLLSQGKFQRKFEKPIVTENDEKKLSLLGKHIRPFIMRRLKRDVLKELPEKLESKIVAELTKEQKKLYLAYLMQIKGEIEEEIKTKGYEKSHIKILAGLTRLRQICCHPAMFVEDYKGESGKLELLEEIIHEALDGGHRILLFSQFTSMLAIIRTRLEALGIVYKYLDGSTETRTRGQLVRQFNEGEGQIFLISLKAGGAGLNLTGADVVIHYDPWWNPAVEDQATDRAHRIGQKNIVHVMKFITHGTIEEKILNLQERKKKLIDAVIQPGETLVSKLTEAEIRELFELK